MARCARSKFTFAKSAVLKLVVVSAYPKRQRRAVDDQVGVFPQSIEPAAGSYALCTRHPFTLKHRSHLPASTMQNSRGTAIMPAIDPWHECVLPDRGLWALAALDVFDATYFQDNIDLFDLYAFLRCLCRF